MGCLRHKKRKGAGNRKDHGMPTANRNIKDGVFRLLFAEKENAAELYYALTGIKCKPEEIQVITISTVVSGKLKNDMAIVVRNRIMVIGEHMSSPVPNMPVRFLMYTGALYEMWIKMKGETDFIYSSTLYKIPTPEFVLFYNGTAKKPEKEILKLSAAFETARDENLGFIELEVPVYNINKGMNAELFSRSEKLRHYAEFIAKKREYLKLYGNYEEAVKRAVDYCIKNGILAEFLKEHGGRIVSILSTEFNLEDAQTVWRKEGRAEGKVEGRVETIRELTELIRSGLSLEEALQRLAAPINVSG